MKKTIIAFLATSILNTASSQNSVPGELIVNGNFNTTICNSESCIASDPNYVKGWTPSPEIEIGLGSFYNKYLGRQRVLDLAPNSNSCVKQNIKGLSKGVYRLKFQYASRTDQKSQDSKFAVKFDDKVIKRITPLDDRIRTEVIDVNIENQTEQTLQFCSTGEENDKYGPILKSVSFAKKTGLQVDPIPVVVPFKKPGQNLIVNPNFEKNSCSVTLCVYTAEKRNTVQGWIPDTELEIGYGSFYNRFLADQRVLDLAANSNQCVRQVVRDLSPGLYELSFEYAARTGSPLSESEFEVSWDGKVLRKISPLNDRLQKDTVDLEVRQGVDGVLKFCSIGPNNSEGGVLRSVFLQRKKASEQPPGLKPLSIYLDSHSGKCLERQFQFEGGQLTISFDYNIASNAAIKNTLTYVTMDGVPIYQISSCSSGRRLSVETKVEPGSHKLGFCNEGDASDPQHQIVLSNLQLQQKPICVQGWSEDLIKNGGFETNKCRINADYCHYTRQNIQKSVPNWMANPVIEIGKASFYNKNAWSKLSLSTVSELDSSGNGCIKQRIPEITQGKYKLKFDWAAKTGSPLDSNGFSVRIGGDAIQSYVAKSYDINRQALEFELVQNPSDPLLEFCGQGKSDGAGASVDNIQLIKLKQC